MGVPATTGVLRTNIEDMLIGDFIRGYYKGSNIWGIGDRDTLPEAPLLGASTNTPGFFYFVKVAKGLLLADRVVQQSVPWNTLNTAGLIEGTLTVEPIMPLMTGPSGNGFVVSSSHELSAAYSAWKMFNRANGADQTRFVAPAISPLTITFKMDVPRVVTQYDMYNAMYPTASPRIWTFEGSDTGSFTGEQVVLDTRDVTSTGENSTGANYEYRISNTQPFQYYRLNVTANRGYTGYTSIEEMQLFSQTVPVEGVIRAPSGGLAYSGLGGELSTVNHGLGAFPSNNEWDRFVVNFPLDKIQDGKTLEDVFHIANVYTFCRETPANGTYNGTTYGNTYRVTRGYTARPDVWADFSIAISTYSATLYGYRPMFEYKEVE